jgi:two-component system OmpR family sensor kinase/two-component system sensor histidine kinase BaeS
MLVVGGLSIIVGLVLTQTLVTPLANLAQTARAFAAHQWNRRAKVKGAREIADVALAFNEMADEIQRAETQRRNMIADIAHELRTPLTVMQGNLRALLDEVYPLEIGEIAILYDETRVLSRLVDDLRELALADAGQLPLHLGVVDPGEVLSSTVANFAIAAESQNVQIVLKENGPLPAIRADVDRMAQIVRNFIVNALHHTSGGSITVSAEVIPADSTQHDMVRINVSDTGEGIPPEVLPHVFDRFYRGDKSRARASGSSGLGLAIAKAWVEAMGGRIGVESTPGKGSRFWFALPTAQM